MSVHPALSSSFRGSSTPPSGFPTLTLVSSRPHNPSLITPVQLPTCTYMEATVPSTCPSFAECLPCARSWHPAATALMMPPAWQAGRIREKFSFVYVPSSASSYQPIPSVNSYSTGGAQTNNWVLLSSV